MNAESIIGQSFLILLFLGLPAFGFAWRGIALLCKKKHRRNRMVSVSGIAATVALGWLLVVIPRAVYQLLMIFVDFELELPWSTEWTITLNQWYLKYGGFFLYAFGPALAVCTLTVPEVLFYQPRRGYAGFWKRLLAFAVDLSIVRTVVFPGTLLFLVLGMPLVFLIYQFAVETIGFWLYCAGFESSRLQATPGKMLMKIQVCDESNQRISFALATARFFGKVLSAAVLGVGFLIAAFTSRKQALHDLLTGCLVVNRA